jgi:uncharacterized membrane protein
LEPIDKIYYIRAILGIIAGVIIALSISPDTNQGTIIGIIFITNGIFPFIFLLIMFMILAYTGLHQNLAT